MSQAILSHTYNSLRGSKKLALIIGACVALVVLVRVLPAWLVDVPEALVLPVSDWFGRAINWFARDAAVGPVAIKDMTRALASVVEMPIDLLTILLSDGWSSGAGFNKTEIAPPLSWLGVILSVAWISYRISGLGLAFLTLGAGAYLVSFGLWTSTMTTLSSVLICVVLTLALGIFFGIRSYRSPRTETVTRGIMNVMQTVPIFSYLVPTLLLFGYGPSAALFATVVYALPPMVHATVLALRTVPVETLELAQMSGCTKRQRLWKVEIPVAVPQISIGLNQVVMMSLNMVIIASMIGAGGLGFDVLRALRRLDIGVSLQAGLAIVALAVVLDRLTQAAAARQSTGQGSDLTRRDLGLVIGLLALTTLASLAIPALAHWPKDWVLTTAPIWNTAVSWINREFFDVLEAVRVTLLLGVMYPLRDLLLALPYPAVIGGLMLCSWHLGGTKLSLIIGGFLAFIAVCGFWDAAMVSVYLTTISVSVALLMGMPLGIWLASKPGLKESATMVLDTLQTLPTLVYLLPAVMLFRNGDFAALIAITSYALAPAVRYGMDGMRGVPANRLELAAITGASRWQTFTKIRLPAAAPTLILGINQTVMMALSMLIIAALVGTRELGQEVFTALSRGNTGTGVVAGLCVAAIALTFDGLLNAWSAKMTNRTDQ